jgi:hypothetical protein
MKHLYAEIMDIVNIKQLEALERLGWDEYEIVIDYMEYCFDNSYKFNPITWDEYFHYIY